MRAGLRAGPFGVSTRIPTPASIGRRSYNTLEFLIVLPFWLIAVAIWAVALALQLVVCVLWLIGKLVKGLTWPLWAPLRRYDRRIQAQKAAQKAAKAARAAA
jgi:hypothetical protein